jgi:hypothetical protein
MVRLMADLTLTFSLVLVGVEWVGRGKRETIATRVIASRLNLAAFNLISPIYAPPHMHHELNNLVLNPSLA